MSKLSEASLELARARPRALPPPAPAYNVHPPCKRCQRQCDFCLDFMADHAAAYADELAEFHDE